MTHQVTFSDVLWRHLQELSGLSNPASYARDIVTNHVVKEFRDRAQTPPRLLDATDFEARWHRLGCDTKFDDQFAKVRDWFISEFDSEAAALALLEDKAAHKLHSPRAFLVSEYNKTQNTQNTGGAAS